jgi:hypothetical protein
MRAAGWFKVEAAPADSHLLALTKGVTTPAADRAASYMAAATAGLVDVLEAVGAPLGCLIIEAAAVPGTRGGVYKDVSPPLEAMVVDPCP